MAPVDLDRGRSSSHKTEKRTSGVMRESRGRSVASASAATLIEEDVNTLRKTVKLIEKIVEYIDQSQASTARKGFRIDAMNDTAFAKELMKLGIKGSQDYKDLNNTDAYWTISGIGETSNTQDLSKKNYINIRDLLTKEYNKSKNDGYLVTFKANIKDIWIDSAITSPTAESTSNEEKDVTLETKKKEEETEAKATTKTKEDAAKAAESEKDAPKEETKQPELEKKRSGATSLDRGKIGVGNFRNQSIERKHSNSGGNSASVELINENLEEEWKEVRLQYPFDKYFNGERDDSIKSGMKGFMITSINGTSFGKDFRNLGISNKWRIWKINDLDVCKLNHMVLRNKLTMAAKARNTDAQGYNITFVSPGVKLENLKNFTHVSASVKYIFVICIFEAWFLFCIYACFLFAFCAVLLYSVLLCFVCLFICLFVCKRFWIVLNVELNRFDLIRAQFGKYLE